MAESLSQDAQLLGAAIGEPFVEAEEEDEWVEDWLEDNLCLTVRARSSPIMQWYRLAQREAPLWCFDKVAFAELQSGDIPSSYPLRLITARIRADEISKGQAGSPLRTNIYVRRIGLASTDEMAGVQVWRESSPDVPAILTGGTMPYEAIGAFEIDYKDFDPPSRSRGRPPLAVPDSMLEPLFRKGEWLFTRIWEVPSVQPTSETTSRLSALGIREDDHLLWCNRLALPMLSAAEIEAILSLDDEWVTALRMTIFSLAHRLGLEAPHVARRVVGSSAEDGFKNWQSATGTTNPINPYLPTTP